MPAAREDYLLRMIQQAAAALRRLRERLARGDSAEEIVADAQTATSELLGPRGELFERLDPHSAAQLLRDPERVRLWADLLAVRADALAAVGKGQEADRLHVRSNALRAAVPEATNAAPHSRSHLK